MDYYRLHEPNKDSHDAIVKNGFAYTSDASGYSDLIMKGYPKPSDTRTILAEIYATKVPPILWSTLAPVWKCAFLVTAQLLHEFQIREFSGFEPIPVEIAKVAAKGIKRSHRKEYSGEPEDLIYNRRNLLRKFYDLPTLWGIAITGEMAVAPKEENSSERMQPFVFTSSSSPDLFYTVHHNQRHGKPILCSERFKCFLIDNQVENVSVDPCSEIWLDTRDT